MTTVTALPVTARGAGASRPCPDSDLKPPAASQTHWHPGPGRSDHDNHAEPGGSSLARPDSARAPQGSAAAQAPAGPADAAAAPGGRGLGPVHCAGGDSGRAPRPGAEAGETVLQCNLPVVSVLGP